MNLYEDEERVVFGKDDAATCRAVYDRVMKLFCELKQFNGESLGQSDGIYEHGPQCLIDIADNIIELHSKWKE